MDNHRKIIQVATLSEVEVFKTNVGQKDAAESVIKKLNKRFPDYKINFDLDDCDRILRVESVNGPVDTDGILKLLQELDYWVEVLE